MKRILKLLGLLIVIAVVIFVLGPRPDNAVNMTFKPENLGDDLDAYLKQSEAGVADLRDNAAKEIIWNNPYSKKPTDFSVVYIHGFSASKQETLPVSTNVAKALNANLFLTRLTGHGRNGPAMAEATMSDWMNDTAEAIAIGERLGKKIILVSASTGGSLSTLAMTKPELADHVAALVMISPNFAIQGAPTWMLNMPWAETILPAVLGKERSFKPASEAQAKAWTHTYPSSAVFPMGALLKTLDGINYDNIKKPALFIYSNKDKVVVPEKTKEVIKKWGGPTSVLEVDDSVNPYNHVIAGDILSPNTTQKVSDAIIDWVGKL